MKCPYCDGKGQTNGVKAYEIQKCHECGGTGYVTSCAFCKGTVWYTPSGLFNPPNIFLFLFIKWYIFSICSFQGLVILAPITLSNLVLTISIFHHNIARQN